ncbi:hypothetical protein OS493_002330 [Desmophyllum pertusum]|uniref:PHTF1/2 N-terminal domain-containing protein n=1 Tax=Desmophyllum pertusum TaxID=174260 RepID=A0A9X0CM39_9CNID|nr:hypothetical protein OS493_002330 [Desmophyllum pertusum]
MAIDQSISWFQQKLGKYDKASWERTFEDKNRKRLNISQDKASTFLVCRHTERSDQSSVYILSFGHVLVLVIYLREWESHWKVVTWSETYGPALIMVLLGVLYMYMVSTDYSSSSQRRKAKTINRRRRVARQKRKSNAYENGEQHDVLVTNGIRQRKPQQPANSGSAECNNIKDTIEAVENVDKDNENEKTEEELSESGETNFIHYRE